MNIAEFLEEYVPSDCREEARDKLNNIMREALTKYAWWKDGTQYVGCGITTLKEALDEVVEETDD